MSGKEVLLKFHTVVCVGLLGLVVAGCDVERDQGAQPSAVEPPTSLVSRTPANELVLKQEVTFAAPVEAVWRAYTTAMAGPRGRLLKQRSICASAEQSAQPMRVKSAAVTPIHYTSSTMFRTG